MDDIRKANYESCRSLALAYERSAPHSAKMLREKLKRKGFEDAEIEAVFNEMRRAGVLDEERMLRSYASYLADRKFFGKLRIRTELSRKFDREVVSEFFESAIEDTDFKENARILAEKYGKRGGGKPPEAIARYLSSHGYAANEIAFALKNQSAD